MAEEQLDSEAPRDYPWYREVGDGTLEQGDLLVNFPIVAVVSSYDEIIAESVEFRIDYFDAIVLSQSCDLAAGKIDHVVLCPYFANTDLAAAFGELGKTGWEKRVHKGTWESLYLLPPCKTGELDVPSRVVNFRQVVSVPFDVVAAHAARQDHRARLSPPYREHLAQAFARFIMRIGFPIDMRL